MGTSNVPLEFGRLLPMYYNRAESLHPATIRMLGHLQPAADLQSAYRGQPKHRLVAARLLCGQDGIR